MAETKGITIDFYGNTLDFDKSIDGINKALKLTKQEISTLNKELKLDPSNVEKLESRFNSLKQQQSLLTEQVEMYKKRLAELGNYADLPKEQQKEFEGVAKALANSQVELDKINKLLASMPRAELQALSKELDEVGNKLNSVGSTIEGVGKKLSVLSVATTGLITAGLSYNATLEQQTALFTTLTGSAEKAEEVLSAIRQDASSSPFDVTSLISANQYLISAGVEAENSRDVIMDLANAISATGGGNSELQRMAQNLQQIQNNGKASTIDIRQFGNAGINLFSLLADSTGKTVTELQDMDITFDMIADALANASSEGGKYFGAMEKQSETMTGKINKLKAQFEELLGQLTESLMPFVTNFLDKLQELIDKFENLDDSTKNIITKIGVVVSVAGPLLTIIGKLIGEKGLGGITKGISKLLKSEGLTKMITTLTVNGTSLTGVLKTLVSTISSFINPVTIVIGILATLYASNEEFRTSVNNLVKNLLGSLKPAFEAIKQIIQAVISVVGSILSVLGNLASLLINTLAKAVSPVISVFGNFASLLIGTVAVAINKVVEVIKTIINWLGQMFSKFKDTTFGQGFIKVLESIGNAINTLIGWIKDVLGWFNGLINKAKEFLGIDSQVSGVSSKYTQSTGRVVNKTVMTPALQSSGLGINLSIKVDNNGQPIDEQEVSRWTDIMVARLDTALGRRM